MGRKTLTNDGQELVLRGQVAQQSFQYTRGVIWIVDVDTGIVAQHVLMEEMGVVVGDPQDQICGADFVAVEINTEQINDTLVCIS